MFPPGPLDQSHPSDLASQLHPLKKTENFCTQVRVKKNSLPTSIGTDILFFTVQVTWVYRQFTEEEKFMLLLLVILYLHVLLADPVYPFDPL